MKLKYNRGTSIPRWACSAYSTKTIAQYDYYVEDTIPESVWQPIEDIIWFNIRSHIWRYINTEHMKDL